MKINAKRIESLKEEWKKAINEHTTNMERSNVLRLKLEGALEAMEIIIREAILEEEPKEENTEEISNENQ